MAQNYCPNLDGLWPSESSRHVQEFWSVSPLVSPVSKKHIFFSPVSIMKKPMFVSTFEPYSHELRTARGSRNSIAVEKRALVGFPESRSATDQ